MRFSLQILAISLGLTCLVWSCDGALESLNDGDKESSTSSSGKGSTGNDDDVGPGEDGPDAPGGDDLYEGCTEEAMVVCRQIVPGVYLYTAVGRESPGCKFPTFDDAVEVSLCEGEDVKKFLTDIASRADEEVAVSGTFADWRLDPVPLCAEPPAFSGEPTIDEQYLAPQSSWGIAGDELRLAVVAEKQEFVDNIKKDSSLVIRGTFRYKPIAKVCTNGSVLQKSGYIELKKAETTPE